MAIGGGGKGIQIIVGADYNGRDLARAQRDLNRLQREAAKTQGPMAALGGKLKGMVGPAMLTAGAAAAGFAVKLGVDAVQGAMAEQQELAKLQTALDNVGQGFKMPEVDAFISKLQMAYGESDSNLRPAFQTLVTATGDVAKSMDLMNIAMDVSAGTGKDLSSVTAALAKASNGSFTAIGKLTNGAISPAALASKDLSQVTGELAAKFGGQAAAKADTFAGKLGRLQQAASELSDSFGQGFISAFDDAGSGVDDLQKSLIALQGAAEDTGRQVGDFIQAFGQLGPFLATVQGWYTKLITSTDGWAFALRNLIPGFGPVLNALSGLMTLFGDTGDSAEIAADQIGGGDFTDTGWLDGASAALQVLYDKADAAAAKVRNLKDVMANTGAFMEFQAALDDVAKSFKDNGDKLSVYNDKGRANVKALRDMISAASDAAGATSNVSDQAKIAQSALDTLTGALAGTKMDPATRAALLEPFQALIDQLAQSGVDTSTLQSTINALQGKTIPIIIDVQQHGTLPDGTYYGSGDTYSATGGYRFARGGSVFGAGTHNSDSISAMLSRGEYVLNAHTVKRVGIGRLDQLNNGGSLSGGNGSITVNVTSAPGERADETVPRALRRMAFLAGING